jgi:ElaB/YqjD/DUF883 family membrane-anchored ribosome-binding protein
MTTFRNSVSDRIDSLRDSVARAKDQVGEFYDSARDRVIDGAKATDRTIRAYPYQSLGVALGAGVLLGLLISRPKK